VLQYVVVGWRDVSRGVQGGKSRFGEVEGESLRRIWIREVRRRRLGVTSEFEHGEGEYLYKIAVLRDVLGELVSFVIVAMKKAWNPSSLCEA